jgi:hypothetical protein
MTRLTTNTLVASADYHDALVVARRAKNWLFLLLLLGLLAQIVIFFLVRFDVIKLGLSSGSLATTMPASDKPAGAAVAWAVNSIVYLGSVFSIVMSIVMLLLVLVLLMGRLLGVSNATSAFVWAVVLAVLLFPWQLFYGPETARVTTSTGSEHRINIDDFRVPGVLYTWGELVQGVDFEKKFNSVAFLRYARFAGFPIVAIVLLFMVQAKSSRGVKYALGEADMRVDVTTTEV